MWQGHVFIYFGRLIARLWHGVTGRKTDNAGNERKKRKQTYHSTSLVHMLEDQKHRAKRDLVRQK